MLKAKFICLILLSIDVVCASESHRLNLIDIQSSVLDTKRQISVYLPKTYNKNSQKKYPVVYVFDANFSDMVTQKNSWGVIRVYDDLVDQGLIPESIIVGIYLSKERNNELAGTLLAEKHDQYVVLELKKYVDKSFRTLRDRVNTTIIGVSNGGTAALRIGCKYGNVFGRIADISDGRHLNRKSVINDLISCEYNDFGNKIWISSGTKEMGRFITELGLEDFNYTAEDMALRLQSYGYNWGTELGYLLHDGAEHNVISWTESLLSVYLFLLGDSDRSIKTVSIKSTNFPLSLSVKNRTKSKIFVEYTYNNGMKMTPLEPQLKLKSSDVADLYQVRSHFSGTMPERDNLYPPDWMSLHAINRHNIDTDNINRSYITNNVLEAKESGVVTVILKHKNKLISHDFEIGK